MAGVDDLPADQKAVIQLLLKQGKSYAELAGLLRLDEAGVRDRALDALDALGPDDPGDLPQDRQDEIADYLLGQQTASQRAATRSYLEGAAAGRAWARVVSSALRPMAGDNLPDIPTEVVEAEQAFDALEARKAARDDRARSSKLGGILLLVGVGIALAVGVILLVGGGDDDDGGDDRAATTQTATDAQQPTVEAQINLTGQNGSDAIGVVQVLSQGDQRAIAVSAQDMQPGSRYVVWLYNSPSEAEFLGFAPPVGDDGRLAGLAPLPANAGDFRSIVVSRERTDRPTRPSTLVLRGEFADAATPDAGGGAAPEAGGDAAPGDTGTAPDAGAGGESETNPAG